MTHLTERPFNVGFLICTILTLHTLCFQVSQELPLNNTYKTPDRLTEDSSSQGDVLRGCPLLLVLWFSGTPLEGRQPIANSCLTARHLTKELKEEVVVLRGKIIAIFYVRSRAVVPSLLSFCFCFLLLNNKDPFEGKHHKVLILYLTQEVAYRGIVFMHWIIRTIWTVSTCRNYCGCI